MARWSRLWQKDGVGWSNCCLDKTGVGVRFIAGRFAAGDSIRSIAKDYGVTDADVVEAIRLWMTAAGGWRGERVENRMRAMLLQAERVASAPAYSA